MKARPILFSAPMVRALLNGSKTQTRREVNTEIALGREVLFAPRRGKMHALTFLLPEAKDQTLAYCPYGQPGDRLWVREAWAHDAESLEQCRVAHEDAWGCGNYGPYYRATESAPDHLRWRPSIHMPRWASRITLEITEVRVERLQEISEADSLAEGISPKSNGRYPCQFDDGKTECLSPITSYISIWSSIRGPDSWAANPWVWVVEFKAVQP